MTRPKLLDLFCKQGGAGMGYHRAGFDVVGVDIEPQPRYPFEFVQADALAFVREHGHRFDAIHGSPPCQRYTTGGRVSNRKQRPDLIGPTREAFERTGKPWVIENVPESPLRPDAMLCGSHFGLQVRRHRIFESNVPLVLDLPPCDHSKPIVGVYGHMHGGRGAWHTMLPSTFEMWCEAMGIDWMDRDGLSQAIPPAYTEAIGRALLATMNAQPMTTHRDTDDELTPPEIFEPVLEALDVQTFNVDVASHPQALVPAHVRYFGPHRGGVDGLTAPWDGLGWVQPPYSNPRPWIRRAAKHESVLLINATTDTKDWHGDGNGWAGIWSTALCVVFVRGRIRFRSPHNPGRTSPAKKPSALVFYAEPRNLAPLERLGRIVIP